MRSVSRGRRTGRLELLLSAREVFFYTEFRGEASPINSLNKVGGHNSQTSQQIKYVNSLISNPPLLHLRLTAGPVLTAPQFS